jgi:hypothetical protein
VFTAAKSPIMPSVPQLLALLPALRGPDVMATVIRVHPCVVDLTRSAAQILPYVVQAENRGFTEVAERVGMPSLTGAAAFWDVLRGRHVKGLTKLVALLKSGQEDIVATHHDYAAWHLIALHSYAAHLARGGATGMSAAEIEAARNELRRHAAVAFDHADQLSAREFAALSDVTSFAGDRWMTCECVARVMRLEGSTDAMKLKLVASLIRINLLDEAEEILVSIRARRPGDKEVLKFTTWLEARRSGHEIPAELLLPRNQDHPNKTKDSDR